ncbi:MAG: TatD family hydrolase [Bacteroidales bacterium]|nr:TatD family hydrolase [Bacteroidales bacterium]
MNLPGLNDFIDIHNHGAVPAAGIFQVENINANQPKEPDNTHGLAYTVGIHPWYLTEENFQEQMEKVIIDSNHENVIAIGEAGFDKIKGPSADFQREAFIRQIVLSEERGKPLYIHCVRAWEELISVRKNLKPKLSWLVHGFRGKSELALQLISKGIYLSFWCDFIIRPEAEHLIKSVSLENFFLETDGCEIEITTIYNKVSEVLGITVEELKRQIYSNFMTFFGI